MSCTLLLRDGHKSTQLARVDPNGVFLTDKMRQGGDDMQSTYLKTVGVL